MRESGATLDDYEALVGVTPNSGGKGTMAELLGADGTRRMAKASMDFDPEAFTAAIEGVMLAGIDPVKPLDMPVCVLRVETGLGAAFRAEDEGPFLDANPGGVVELVPGAGHMIHDTHPELFLQRLREFLDRFAPRA